MNREQFNNLRIGDIVSVTVQGNNKGKKGVVEDIIRSPYYTVYLKCLNEDFEFYDKKAKDRRSKNGAYAFNYCSLQIASDKDHGKRFYIVEMFGGRGVAWSADEYTLKEISLIERFLKDFNKKVHGLSIEEVVILEKDPDED